MQLDAQDQNNKNEMDKESDAISVGFVYDGDNDEME